VEILGDESLEVKEGTGQEGGATTCWVFHLDYLPSRLDSARLI